MLLNVELLSLNPVCKDYFRQFYPAMLYIAAFCNSLLSTKSPNCCMHLGSIPLYCSQERNGSLVICRSLAVTLKCSLSPKHLKDDCVHLWPCRVSVTSPVWFTHRKLIYGDWSDMHSAVILYIYVSRSSTKKLYVNNKSRYCNGCVTYCKWYIYGLQEERDRHK